VRISSTVWNFCPGGGARNRSECRFSLGQPASSGRAKTEVDHAGRAADIEMRAERLVVEDLRQRDRGLFLVEIDLDALPIPYCSISCCQ
jgi:hypothetical protein